MKEQEIDPRDIATWNTTSSNHTDDSSQENNDSDPVDTGNDSNTEDPTRPGPVNGPAGF